MYSTVSPTDLSTSCVTSVFSDLCHYVLVIVRTVPPPWGAGLAPWRGAEHNGWSKRTRGSRCGAHASPEGHSQRSAQVWLKGFQLISWRRFQSAGLLILLNVCFPGCTLLFLPTQESLQRETSRSEDTSSLKTWVCLRKKCTLKPFILYNDYLDLSLSCAKLQETFVLV